MVFLDHKLLCYKLRLSFLKLMIIHNFFQSILMQPNCTSAKIAILSKHQRWRYLIYWPYIRDIRPIFRGLASLLSRRAGLQLFSARFTFVIWFFSMLKQNLKFLREQALNKSLSWLQPCFSEMSWSILVRFMKHLSVGVKESRQRGKNIVHVI